MTTANGNGFCPAVIRDGYTRDCFIKAMPGLHPSVRFKYRPMLMQNRSTITHEMSKAYAADHAARADEISAKAIAGYVVSWDIADVDQNGHATGGLLPITTPNILRLQPRLQARIFEIISGQSAGDHPAEDAAGPEATSGHSLDDALCGKSPEASEAAAEKN